MALRDDDRLCIVQEDEQSDEPQIICSLGLSLFIEELGWSKPPSRASPWLRQGKDVNHFTRTPIAQLAGVVVFEVTP